jgi:hypothetical protein
MRGAAGIPLAQAGTPTIFRITIVAPRRMRGRKALILNVLRLLLLFFVDNHLDYW